MLLFILGWSLFIASAGAMEFEEHISISPGRHSIVLIMRGMIDEGDSERFAEVIRQVRPDQVWLDSDGGKQEEGFKLGWLIRRNGLATHIPTGATCASTCVDVFMGGVVRSVDQDRSLGIHKGSFAAYSDRRRSPQVYEEIGIVTTAKWGEYVQKMGVSRRLIDDAIKIKHSGIYWLTRRQMADYNLINEVE